MAQLSLEAIPDDGPFSEIVGTAQWEADVKDALRIAPALGWLVAVNDSGVMDRLVGFSSEAVGRGGTLHPPADLLDVQRRAGTAQISWFNTDWTAKGLGSVMTNTPHALDPRSVEGTEAVIRSVPFTSETHVTWQDRNDSRLFQALRFARHALLVMRSVVIDACTNSTAGTERTIERMDQRYGNASLAFMPVPPIWQQRQRAAGMIHNVKPQMVLVRGGRFRADNPMRRVGSYPSRHVQ